MTHIPEKMTVTIDGEERTYRLETEEENTACPSVPLPRFWKDRVNGESYLYIDSEGDVDDDDEEGSNTDKKGYEMGNYYIDSPDSRKYLEAKVALEKHRVAMIRKYGACQVDEYGFHTIHWNMGWHSINFGNKIVKNSAFDRVFCIPLESTQEERDERVRLLQIVYGNPE